MWGSHKIAEFITEESIDGKSSKAETIPGFVSRKNLMQGIRCSQNQYKCQRSHREKTTAGFQVFHYHCDVEKKKNCRYYTSQNYEKLLLKSQIPCTDRAGYLQRNKSHSCRSPLIFVITFRKWFDTCVPVSSYDSSSPWQSVAKFRFLEKRV